MKQRIKKVIVFFCVILVIGLAYACWVNYTHLGIPCYFHLITGLHCPSCGITHMILNVLQFKFRDAFYDNQLLFFLLPVWVFIFVITIINYIVKGSWKLEHYSKHFTYLSIFLLILFGVIRNIFL